MPLWAIVLIYALVLCLFLTLHQMLFKYRFRECSFTLIFLDAVSVVVMLSTGFEPLFSWLCFATAIVTVLYAVYVALIMRHIRTKISSHVKSLGMDDMIKAMMQGLNINRENSEQSDVFGESEDIKATEEHEEEDEETEKPLKKEDFYSSVIIDDEQKTKQGEKKDDEEK